MKDLQGRNINYMRISITDRCNLRCRYCMPEDIELLPMEELLRFEEIGKVCTAAVALGITRFKITGGEPLVRRNCTDLISIINRIPGVEQVTMTTNGVLLTKYAAELRAAGLSAVNISLDTLDRQRFIDITGANHLQEVLQSIDEAMKQGLKVKINTVLQRDKNADEWPRLIELAKDRPIDVRFIELMPIGKGDQNQGVSNDSLLNSLREMFSDVYKDECIHGNGPAVYYHISGFDGSIGFISAIHGKFCGSCNRLRMTSTGELKPCLCYKDTVSVRNAVRYGSLEDVKHKLIEAIELKPEQHCFDNEQSISEKRKMVQIGG